MEKRKRKRGIKKKRHKEKEKGRKREREREERRVNLALSVDRGAFANKEFCNLSLTFLARSIKRSLSILRIKN